ncbi:hypothetical protein A2U01_0018034, partial [Trifolium medium]|nr:hypothetical protein [Trifolium medium]
CICALPILAGLSYDDGDLSFERYFTEGSLGYENSLTSVASLFCRHCRVRPWWNFVRAFPHL